VRALIASAKPKAVVFYGHVYLESWAAIAGQPLQPASIADRPCFVTVMQSSYIVAVPHPMTWGLTNHFWESVGIHIQSRTSSA